jgi:HEAT repeat protein
MRRDIYDDMIDLQALAKANDPRAVAAVEPLLGEGLRVEDKRTVVRRLGRLRGRAVEDTLSVIADRDSSPEIRVKAAAALGRSDHQRALPFLLTGLSSEDVNVREDAIRALSKVADVEVQEAIRRLLSDPEPSARVVAASALVTSRYLPAMRDLEAACESTKGANGWLLRRHLHSLQRHAKSG